METLSKVSYDAASLSLEKQERLIEEIRARTGLLLAVSSLAVAFLGRAAVDSANTVLVSLALLAFAFSVGAAMYVLLPKSNLTFSLRGAGVYEGLYEFADQLDEVYRRLAYDLDAFWDANDVVVAQLLKWFKLSAFGVAARDRPLDRSRQRYTALSMSATASPTPTPPPAPPPTPNIGRPETRNGSAARPAAKPS